jgi:hypothetical protein
MLKVSSEDNASRHLNKAVCTADAVLWSTACLSHGYTSRFLYQQESDWNLMTLCEEPISVDVLVTRVRDVRLVGYRQL